MPELLRQGYIYVAETPLYEIIVKDGKKKKSLFAYTVQEKDIILDELARKNIKVIAINRSKGLGENDPDMMWTTTMNPETRRLVKLDIDPENEWVQRYTTMLFGKDPTKERKPFIFNQLEQGLQDIELDMQMLKDLSNLGV